MATSRNYKVCLLISLDLCFLSEQPRGDSQEQAEGVARAASFINDRGGIVFFANKEDPRSRVTLQLKGERFDDACIISLNAFKNIRHLFLENTRITERGLLLGCNTIREKRVIYYGWPLHSIVTFCFLDRDFVHREN